MCPHVTEPVRSSAETPLERQLRAGGGARPAAIDAFKLARRNFLAGERLDMGALARELGINRATLYRWVGTRDQLLVEVVWSVWTRSFAIASDLPGVIGGERVTQAISRSVTSVINHPGWRRRLQEEGELMLRLMTRNDAGFQSRLIQSYRRLLAEEVDAGNLSLPVDLDELAYALARISESYVYRELITGDPPDARGVEQLLRLILC